MWADEERLLRLLNATHYKALEHDVLTIDTASMVAAYEPSMWLCHMNSGNTFPMPTPRDIDIQAHCRLSDDIEEEGRGSGG